MNPEKDPIAITREFIAAFEKKHHMPGIIAIGIEIGEFILVEDTDVVK